MDGSIDGVQGAAARARIALLVAQALHQGVRVIGDAHGCADRFHEALDGAQDAELMPVVLGDVADRGPDSPGTIRLLLDAVRRGALFVPGNHCWKLTRLASGHKVRVGGSLSITLDQLAAAPDGETLLRDFRALVLASPAWLRVGRWIFVHGAFLPEMSWTEPFLLGEGAQRKAHDAAFSRALYGQPDGRTEAGAPRQSIAWVDEIPAGMAVAVGHAWMADAVSSRVGAAGGVAWHIDTGAGKGGVLSWLDLAPADLTAQGVALPRACPADWCGPDGAPLLTLMVGPSGSGKTTWAKAHFPVEAVVSTDDLRAELTGDFRDQSRNAEVFRTARLRASARLAQALPVVLDMTHLRAHDRRESAGLVPPWAPVRYVIIDRPTEDKHRDGGWRVEATDADGAALMDSHAQRFALALPEILRGDGRVGVEILDLRPCTPRNSMPAAAAGRPTNPDTPSCRCGFLNTANLQQREPPWTQPPAPPNSTGATFCTAFARPCCTPKLFLER